MIELQTLIQSYQEFKTQHPNPDPSKLPFKLADYEPEIRDFILWQFNPKAQTKFAHFLPPYLPASVHVEQASGWQAASFKAELVGQGHKVLDLTGGLGIDSMAFAGSNSVTHIEINPTLQPLAAHNFKVLNLKIESRLDSAEAVLKTQPKTDWIFLDPDRRAIQGAARVAFQNSLPNLLEIKDSLLSLAGMGVLVKSSAMIDLSLAIKQLETVRKIFVLSVQNECKEVLFELGEVDSDLQIHATEWGKSTFVFKAEEERRAEVRYAPVQEFLYEPWAALMKAAPYKLICQRFGVKKVAASTHLYTSQDMRADFPGRIFKVVAQGSNFGLKQALVSTRNYPLTAQQLRQKLNLKEGGQDYIFGLSLQDGSKKLVHAQRLN
jgi:16S rRNA G966 N2-methylase RsmD